MPHIIHCPSGLTGSIRGLKVCEERVLADRKLQKAGSIVDELLSASGGFFQQHRKKRRATRPGRPERAGPTRTGARPSHAWTAYAPKTHGHDAEVAVHGASNGSQSQITPSTSVVARDETPEQ
jgi:hypothetical protein